MFSRQPGVALFTALLSKAQSMIRAPPPDPLNPQHAQAPEPGEVEQW
jgi:DNA topoisomerase 2-associated protein PAT1